MSSIQLHRFGFRLPKVSSVNGRHQTLCLWRWIADLLPPCRPHHVTHFPSPVTGQRPCWMWESLSFPWGPECHLRAIFLGCQRGLHSALTTSSTGASTPKSFWELCRSLLSGFHGLFLFLQTPLKIFMHIQVYNCPWNAFRMLPRLEHLPASKWLLLLEIIQTENQFAILSKPIK